MNRENRQKWQADLLRAAGQEPNPACDLISALHLDPDHFAAIKNAVHGYICASFERPRESTSDEALCRLLDEELDTLANRTPNGALVPKMEFQNEYNEIHRAVASWLESLNITHLIDSIRCPIVIRAVSGAPAPDAEARPYAASKMHVDLWGGDAPDSVDIVIPVLGDIERTTIEWFRPTIGFEEKYLRVMDSYDVAKELEGQCLQYPVTARMGCAYFIDAIVMHRTVRHGGGARVNLQFDLRRPISGEDRRKMHASFQDGRLGLHLDPKVWMSYGSTKFVQFSDTNADAKQGIFRKHQDNQRTYNVVDIPA